MLSSRFPWIWAVSTCALLGCADNLPSTDDSTPSEDDSLDAAAGSSGATSESGSAVVSNAAPRPTSDAAMLIEAEAGRGGADAATDATRADASRPTGTPVALHGQLHVCGTKLCDSQGQVVQLTGWSWGPVEWYGGAKANQPTAAGVANMIQQFHVNVERVATWNANFAQNPAETWKRLDPLIQGGIDKGIYVLVDWHNAENNPLTRLEDAKRFFKTVAENYGKLPNIIYEIFNEPSEVTWKDAIKPYAEQLIPVIRAVDPDGVIVVGNESWSSKPNICADDPLKFDNIMYTVHFYAKTAFNIPDCQYAIDKGLALFFTEWGTTTYTGQGGHDYVSGQKWVDFMNGHQQSWTTFNFGTWDPVGAKPPDDCSSFFIGVDNNGPWTEEQITPDAKWKRDRTPF